MRKRMFLDPGRTVSLVPRARAAAEGAEAVNSDALTAGDELFADGSVSTGQAGCADSGDWPDFVAGTELLLGRIPCSSVGHGRNGSR